MNAGMGKNGTRIYLFYVLIVAQLGVAVGARAQDICGVNLAACDLQTDDRCLAKYYACGQYDTIVRTLYAEDFAPTAVQKYFIGASLYGMHVRTRAKGLQCEFIKGAREYLQDYLTSKALQFQEVGSFGSVSAMDQVYHATKMHEDLKAQTGCLESAYTRARIQNIAKSRAVDLAKNVFLNPNDQMQDHFDTVVLALRGFVSKASDLETGIALRNIEIQSGNDHLDVISGIFADIFGTVEMTPTDVNIDTTVLDDLDRQSRAYLRDVEVEETEFQQALGGVSPEQYAQIRSDNVRNAEDMLKESAFHINMIGELLPTDTDKPFWRVWQAVHAEGDERSAFENLAEIKRQWAEFGRNSGLCVPGAAGMRKWYCRD